MQDFAAIDFETANNERSSVCSVGVVIVCDFCIEINTECSHYTRLADWNNIDMKKHHYMINKRISNNMPTFPLKNKRFLYLD